MAKTKATRRPRGFGNIEQRGPTTFRLRFSVGGQRYQETIEARSRREAENYAATKRVELEKSAKRRRKGLPYAIRFSALLEEFEESEFPDLAPGARDSYLDTFKPLRLYFVDGEGDPLVSEISRADVKRYQSWRRTHRIGAKGGTVSAHTVGRDLRVLHRVFSFALDLDYIDANPAARVKAASPDARTYCILTDDELERLLAECSDPMLRLYVLLLAETGCRAYSEALHLRWEDVDLPCGFLHIVSGRDGHRTKSGASRFVPLTARLRDALRDHAAAYRMNAYRGKRSPWVFHHTRDHRLYKAGQRIKDYKKAFSTARAAAKLPESLRQHDLRHRRVTTWLAAGQPASLVQEAMGHSSITVTEKYRHLAKHHLSALVDEVPARERLKELAG
jgi:integrase